MSAIWDPHEPLARGRILREDFKKLVSFCDANVKEASKRNIATQYISFRVNEASRHPSTGNEKTWYELTQGQRDTLIDKLVSEWQNKYPNDLKTEYVPFSPLDAVRYWVIMDSVPDAQPAKNARFVQHVAATGRAPKTDSCEDDGSAPWVDWLAEEDRIVGDKLQTYSLNQSAGTTTWEVVLDKHGRKKLVIVTSETETESDSDDD